MQLCYKDPKLYIDSESKLCSNYRRLIIKLNMFICVGILYKFQLFVIKHVLEKNYYVLDLYDKFKNLYL